jgi:hypothetical protein
VLKAMPLDERLIHYHIASSGVLDEKSRVVHQISQLLDHAGVHEQGALPEKEARKYWSGCFHAGRTLPVMAAGRQSATRFVIVRVLAA